VSHLFVLVCVVAFVRLGFWQLDRHADRQERNDLIAARQSEPVRPLGEVIELDADADEIDAAVHRRVSVTGTWRADEEVLIRNRTFQGAPGSWVVTPLVLPDGSAVAVNRGWVPVTAGSDGDPSSYAPATGTVTVTGLIARSDQRAGLGAVDPATGQLRDLARVDVGRIAQQLDERLYPVYVTLRHADAATGELPLPVPPAELDDGPHLGYAGQWFIFATLTCIVYPLLLRRTARHRGAEHDSSDPPGAGPDPLGADATDEVRPEALAHGNR
jgi:surfeit locus 1 family protein